MRSRTRRRWDDARAWRAPEPVPARSAGAPRFAVVGPDWTREVYQSLLDSRIGDALTRTIIPVLGTVLGPLLPSYVRQVMV